jgi:hypothetical protein
MANRTPSPTRAEFLKRIVGLAAASSLADAAAHRPKLLIVVAHPDDEYMFAAPPTGWCANWNGQRIRW